MAKNRYTRALKVLKNSQVDEKLQMLESLPTNNTTGLYVVEPAIVNTVTVPGEVDREADFTQDGDGEGSYDGTDTTGLFLTDGTILTIEPPGDTSYILGPMASMWYAWGNFTQIGYIRQSDRKMVNLARITGELGSWDGSSNFTSYGQLTLEQAVWFQGTPKLNGADNDTPNYRAFYPGPPSNVADEHGRYLCVITGTPKSTSREEEQRTPDVMGDAESQGYPWEKKKARDEDKDDELMQLILNAAMLGLDIAAVVALLFPEPASSAAGAAHLATKLRYVAKLRRLRGALNPFGQRAVRAGAAGRKRVPVYSGRPYKGKRGFGKTTYGTTDPKTAATYSNPGPLKGTPGTGSRVNPRGTVDSGTLPQRYIDKYGSRSVLGQRQVKLGQKAARRTFGEDYHYHYYFDDIREQIKNYIFLESEAPGSGIPGGTAAADGYVDEVSKTSSPEELEKASNDANDIATEGGRGLSDSDLEKIDKDAEAEAKRLTDVDINDAKSMSDEQLYASLEAIYEIDPDWLESTMDKLKPLIPQDKIDDLLKEYDDKFNERVANKESIEDAIKELDENYRSIGGRPYDTRYGWGGQYTKQMFESSGQSFEKYDELRGQIGFLNNNSGPNKYGQYYPIFWDDIMYAKKNGNRPEQFTGVAREIVERSYRLDEITSNPNYPRPGRNLYYNEEDYNEAKSLQDEYQSVFAEYVELWEGPGGFDDLSKRAWNFYEVSENARKKDAADAQKRRDDLQSELDAIKSGKKYDDAFYRKIDKLYRPYNIAVVNEWSELYGDLPGGYDYFPEFDDIGDVIENLPDADAEMTIEDLGAAGYAAYKAGGGDAKVKEGFTVAEVIKQGQINLNAFLPGAPVQKPIKNPERDAPNLLRSLTQTITDLLPPASKYKTNIAMSILKNEPIQNVASPRDIELLINNINPNSFGVEYSPFRITRTPIPYADENIRERPDGTVEPNPDPSTNNTGPVYHFTDADLTVKLPSVLGGLNDAQQSYANPLAAAGQAQVQLVIPDNNPENAYIRYVDHAYLNTQSADPGEIPKGDWLSPIIANLLSFAASDQTGRGEGYKAFEDRQHTGGFENYPPNIKGDQVTRFDVPYGKLPPNHQQFIRDQINQASLGSGSLADTTSISATDAATISGERKRKKKTKPMESYQPNRPKFLEYRDRQPLEELITPKQKRILREIKKPFEIKEAPTKFKVKPTGRNNKVVGAGLMKPIQDPKAFKPDPAIWKAGHKKYNEISSQDKKNHVLELVGASDHHWSTLIERSDRERQEKVNEAMAQEFDREMERLYEKYQEKETKVDKVIQAIKTTSLDKSKIKPVHPDEPPSERVNGYHPKYGQKYKHDKLDPHSAEFMPDTGNPVIDANIRKSTDQERKNRKVKILRKPSGMS
mgnify:CR=1 FL=1